MANLEGLTLMLLVANSTKNNDTKKQHNKMAETLAPGHSSESTQQELSNEYQYDNV